MISSLSLHNRYFCSLKGIAVNIKNKAGKTPCQIAAEKHYDKIVTCIVAHEGASQLRKLCKISPHDISV